MLSFEFFCHKKENSDKVIQVLEQREGFVQFPEEYEDMFLTGEATYEGSASINGKNILDKENHPLAMEDIAGCIIVSPFSKLKEEVDNAPMCNLLDEYIESHELSLPDAIFLQKICLSLNEKLNQNDGYVYLNLKNCENAPLVLDAVKTIFGEFDLLFSLPKNLKFAVPSFFPEKAQANAKDIQDGNMNLGEGYQAFFDDVCGIATPNFEKLEKAEPAKIAKKKEARPVKKLAPKPAPKAEFLKPGTKTEKAVKKDLGGDILFALLFTSLSIAAPYFYFGLLSQSETLYFVLYFVLDIFFLIMSAVALSYVEEGKAKTTKGWYYLGMLFTPSLEIIGTIVFLIIAKNNSWLRPEAYAFFGLGLGYIIIYPLVVYIYKKLRERKQKAKAKK